MTFVRGLVVLLLVSTHAFAQGAGQPVPPLTARATQHPSQAGATPPVVIPFEFLVNRPLVRATINGEGPFALLIAPDTETSRLDPELAEVLQLKAAEGASTITVELGFGVNQTLKVPILVEDISSRVPDLPESLRPRGVLSLSAWPDRLVTLDFTRWRVTIESGALPEPDQLTTFTASATGETWLPLVVGDETVQCLVDPWFPGGLVLPTAAFTAIETTGQPRDAGTLRTRDGVLRVREGRLAHDVTVGPFSLKAPTVLLADGVTTATAGTSWLARYLVTYDLAHGRLRLERGGVTSRTKN